MRDVLFRGKATMSIEELNELEITHENGWVFGNYIENGFSPYIVGDLADVGNDYIAHEWWVEVVPESVGQWTGQKDKRDKKIFEGDEVKFRHSSEREYDTKGVVEYKQQWCGFYFADNRRLNSRMNIEIVGNVYDLSRLFEGATNGSS